MSQIPLNPVQIYLECHPTIEDYNHARLSHGVWAQVNHETGGWRGRLPTVLLLATMLSGFVAGSLYQRMWIVSAPVILGIAGFVPLVFLITSIQYSLKPGAVRLEGIIERLITSSGRSKRKRGGLTWRVAGWVVFFLVCWLTLSLRNSFAPPGAPTAVHDDADVPPPLYINSYLLFFGYVATVISALMLSARAYRRYVSRTTQSSTEQLKPREWEFTEEYLLERSELSETKMKWAAISRFLETPRVIMLYTSDLTFYLVPKKAFVNGFQLAALMGLLMRKVPSGVMQPRGSEGFAVLPVASGS